MRELPVIIVTGAEDDDGSRQTALAAGASDFITKPFESVQLLARTKAQAKQQRTQEALGTSEASKQELEAHNNVDLLTGLANARGFGNAMEESLSYARRHRTEVALMLVRVDKYKVLFLRHGKQVAEDTIRQLAQRLRQDRRREDVLARTELDTFGILMPSANAIGARRIAEQILESVHSEPPASGDVTPPVNLSIAVVSPVITPQTTVEDMLAGARARLQQAADDGGNCVRHDMTDTPPPAAPPAPPTPAAAPEPAPRPATVGADAIHAALQALAAGRQPETDADTLVRSLLPLLTAWNEAHGKRFAGLIGELENALGEASQGTDSHTSAGSL
jgi:diguanylate cyclase (GGDEF)-like protein